MWEIAAVYCSGVSVNLSDRGIKHMTKLRGIMAGATLLIGLGGCYPPTQTQYSPTVIEQPLHFGTTTASEQPQPLHFGTTTASERMPQLYRNPDGSQDTYGPNGQIYT
jgi:hypothetical protein